MEQAAAQKKRIFSAIQPTGVFTLGNYIGAVRNWDKLQEEFDCIYAIADLHAITVAQEPAELRKNTMRAFALMLACGMDPKKSITFVQSQNPHHAELSWVLSCSTMFGELSRMTQFKDKSAKHADNINAGLFTYPVLMAADILAYNADLVPIGADQKQHLELARNIAQRFNQRFGETFTVPDGYFPKQGARLMSLQDPTRKMSKSDENANGCVYILDDKDTILRKFKRAVTDSETEVCFREGKDGINNLMTIYSAVTGKDMDEIAAEFAGKGYGDFKIAVGEAVADHLKPVQTEYEKLIADKAYLTQCMLEGSEQAYRITRKTLQKVYRRVGFIDRKA
ncbi:MAG: tryptophan--tRNA ligase [Oscillospiraceae bacterium]|nr:tryptophan--tRNA ligase [Oscillospiraceae bacterium]